MKICIVINHFQVTDGVARAAIGVANALVGCGVEVTIIPLFLCDRGMLDKLDHRVHVKPFLGFYARGLAKLVDLIPDKLLYKIVIKSKYDIEIGFCMTLPSKIIASSTNSVAKHYLWMHGYDEKLVLKDYYLKADKIVSVSKHNAERLKNDMPELCAIEVCYNLIDDNDVQVLGNQNSELTKNSGSLVAVTVGRQSPEKGYGRLINCVYRLKQQSIKLQLLMIGDGQEHSALVKKVVELDLGDRVFFLGEQKNPHKYTKNADFFICSSYSEGYSTACTEAIMLGVPILTTKVSGAEEIIDESEAGLVVENDDEALYEGLKFVVTNPTVIADWKETLRKTKVRFSYLNRKKELLNVLEIDS